MKEVIKKEIVHDLTQAIEILGEKDIKDFEELKELSDHAIENVALYKDLDIISITVLIYSIYKVATLVKDSDHQELVNRLISARENLKQNKFGKYNSSIRSLFAIVKRSNARVKVHLQDVMQAARIKKGTVLLERGLSIGQAAGLMGLSNWDLQEYAGKTTSLEPHETVPAKMRLLRALNIFGLK